MKKLIAVFLAMLFLLTACGTPAEPVLSTAAPTTPGELTAQIGGETVTFEPWEQAGLPESGCYYLVQDVVLTEKVTVSGQLKLHLNGHVVSGAEGVHLGELFYIPAGGDLFIYDAPDGLGTVIAPRAFTAQPYVKHILLVEGTVTIAGGTLDATAVSLENVSNGACACVEDGGVLNMEGGVITGGTTLCYSLDPEKNIPADSDPAENDSGTEPTEAVETTTVPTETTAETTEPTTELTDPVELELFGKGGSVYVNKGGLLNVTGGTIQNGVAGLGGNIYLEEDAEKPGRMTMSGGTILCGEALFHGGNIYNDGILEMTGGEIVQGMAYNHGGNMVIEGTLEMTGGTIREGRCDGSSLSGKRGGNILVNGKEAVVHISNAQILDGDGHGSENFGGNISVIGQCAREFIITDTVIRGGQAHRGGNVYIGTLAKDVDPENLDYYMKNVTMEGGSSSYRGANLCMDSDLKQVYIELVMDDCIFRSEETGKENIALGAGASPLTWANLTMNGGVIEGGSLTIYGDSTLTANGTTLTMEDSGGQGQLVVNP